MPGSVPKLLAVELCLLTKSRGALEPSLWVCFPAVWTYNAGHISVVCSVWKEESLTKQMTVPNSSQQHRALVCSVLRGWEVANSSGKQKRTQDPRNKLQITRPGNCEENSNPSFPVPCVLSATWSCFLLTSHSVVLETGIMFPVGGNTWSLISHRAFQRKYPLPHFFFSLNSLQAFWYFNSWIVWEILNWLRLSYQIVPLCERLLPLSSSVPVLPNTVTMDRKVPKS